MGTNAVIAALIALAAPAAAPSGPPTMPVADIQRGMKCVGRTVFEGAKIEEFACEILGVLPGAWGPGDDVIVYDGTGRHTALIAAETVLAAGRTARLVTLDDHMGMDLTGPDQAVWKRRAYEIGLPMQFDLRPAAPQPESA